MAELLTIVMYHYVRELRPSRFPDIKGLPTRHFRRQLDYIRRHYNVISGDDIVLAVTSGAPLPPRALLLTFDDGYTDHFTQAFPLLDELRLPACFFPPARPILETCVLDVNKIHFLLAAVPDKQLLVERIFDLLDQHRGSYQLVARQDYWQRLAQPGRYDSREVMFIKRILQRELPLPLRQVILADLFHRHVSRDEAAFAGELYMTLDQLQCLRRHGMTIGSHGYNHVWLDRLDPAGQADEIDRSLSFLALLGVPSERWLMCYPYGAHDASLRSLLAARGCVAGFTTRIGLADLQADPPLALPRLDTNDLPVEAAVQPNMWTAQVLV